MPTSPFPPLTDRAERNSSPASLEPNLSPKAKQQRIVQACTTSRIGDILDVGLEGQPVIDDRSVAALDYEFVCLAALVIESGQLPVGMTPMGVCEGNPNLIAVAALENARIDQASAQIMVEGIQAVVGDTEAKPSAKALIA